MTKSCGMLNLSEADMHVMEVHPNKKAIEHGKQIPYHLQYIRKQKEINKHQSGEPLN